MATVDAGVTVACPVCGLTVRQKAMIPMRGEGGEGIRYTCIDCARKDVVIRPEGSEGQKPADRP